MAIYTEKMINDNWLYADLMDEINELYEQMGSPEAPNAGPTTGGPLDDKFLAHEIGEWYGDEEMVARWANDRRDELLTGLNLGSFPYFKETQEWIEFQDAAWRLFQDYDCSNDPYEKLCDEWDSHQ